MSRAHCIPGLFFLFLALILLIIATVSDPTFPAMDVVKVKFGGKASNGDVAMSQLNLGVWGYCYYETNGDRVCSPVHHAYSVGVQSPVDSTSVTIGPSWTRGLATTAVATVVTFIAFLLGMSQHLTVTLLASIASFLAATITLVAFAIEIALFVYVKHQMDKVNGISPTTSTGPAFWLTFAAFILLILAGCTVCFGRRRDRANSTSYPNEKSGGFFSRFRRN